MTIKGMMLFPPRTRGDRPLSGLFKLAADVVPPHARG